jgi:hypothetical protein
MINNSLVVEQLDLRRLKYYLVTFAFVAGNILLPALCHQFHLAGPVFLPIYFFILTGAYKYGWKTGVAIAVISPLANTALTGMPPTAVLPVILVKGLLLAAVASVVAVKTRKVTIINLLFVILSYQIAGTFLEALYLMDIKAALNDFTLGYPGLLIQLFGSYLILRKM